MKDTTEFYHLHYLQNIEFDVSNWEIWKVNLRFNKSHVFAP